MLRKDLIGSGDKIIRFTMPFFVVGLILNFLFPLAFSVGGPPPALNSLSSLILTVGIFLWLWSVYLIATQAARDQLITTGPYLLVRHPIYTSVALLVLPWLGFLLNSWLGVVVGLALYSGSRKFAPEEERLLSKKFGPAWEKYCQTILIPWL